MNKSEVARLTKKKPKSAGSAGSKPVNEIWWIAIDPSGITLWPYFDLRRCDVVEMLVRDHPDWKSAGWRIAKLRVTEVLPREWMRLKRS